MSGCKRCDDVGHVADHSDDCDPSLVPCCYGLGVKRCACNPRTLTEELEHLERTDPQVGAAARRYDFVVWRMNRRARREQ